MAPTKDLPEEDGNIKTTNTLVPNADERPESLRLDPAEEQDLVSQSNILKTKANALFTTSSFTEAITGYTRALETLPTYLDYELAVLKSNIAACHIKLSEWKEAIDAASDALERLEVLDPVPKVVKKGEGGKVDEQEEGRSGGVVEEVDDQTADAIEALSRSGRSVNDVGKIRIKALLRRAKGRSELGTWSHLQGAQEGMIYTYIPFYPRSRVNTTPSNLYKRLPTTLPHPEPHASRLQNRTISSPYSPPKTKRSPGKGNGRYDGKTEAIGQRILETLRLVDGQFQYGEG